MRLCDAQSDFLSYRQNRKASTAATIVTYRSVIGQFVAYVGELTVESLKIDDVDAWADSLIAQQIAVKTLKNKLAIVRSFIKYLYGKNLTSIRPEAVELPPEPQANEMSYLTREEKEAYVQASLGNTRDHAIVLVLLSSGVRVSELIGIRVGDVHDRSIIIHKGKGQKRRVVFIDQGAKNAK